MDDTVRDAYQYGVWFLDEAGYFNKQKRFWTQQDFPEAQEVRERIAGSLKATGLNDPGMRAVYDMLESSR